jgi:prephenate dehydrogenase
VIQQLTIIGVGLIGGSLAQALKRASVVGEVVGVGRDSAHLQRALELGVIDRVELDPAAAVRGADVVLVATPVGAVETVFRQIAAHLPADAVLTDVGSTKGSVVEAAHAVFGRLPANFVPGHPIAGTEKSGVEAAFAGLFDGQRVILTPTEATNPKATARVRALWEQVGASVVEISVTHHDEVLAATSHLPHLLAFALVDTLATLDEKQEVFEYAAGGFRDFTRIASGDPHMWHDICVHNEPALLKILDRFEADLDRLRQAIAGDDGNYLLEVFSRAKMARDQLCRDEKPAGQFGKN